MKIAVALFFKDFAHFTQSSCVGLHVAGFTSAEYLRSKGIDAQAYAVRHNVDIVNSIDKYNETHSSRLTHVVISAPWISVIDLKNLVAHFSDIKFIVLSHSNVGFLQADPQGVRHLRQYSELSDVYKNLSVGGNCFQFTEWFELIYGRKCPCLPNMYPLPKIVVSKVWDKKSSLKIGAFGAIRPEKNFMTSAAAAVAIHSKLGVPVELHMSTGGDGCKSLTLPAIVEMTEGIPGVKLIRHHWQYWNDFIELIGSMDLLLQVSYTESFNMITADGILKGVSSVVSPVIFWAPDSWKSNIDSALDVAKVGIDLLQNSQDDLGVRALETHNKKAFELWIKWLQS